MLRIATANINGIRAAHRRGFGDWLATRGCDVVTLQEVRCPVEALPEDAFGDYHGSYDAGQIPGRNGVAVLTRVPPTRVSTWAVPDPVQPLQRKLRPHATEGRYIEVDLAELTLGQTIHLSELKLPKGVEVPELKLGKEHDVAVVIAKAARTADEDETPAAEGDEK